LGDWEADTIIGKGHQGVLVTLTERVSILRAVKFSALSLAENVVKSAK
jgi:IS30 family transposase